MSHKTLEKVLEHLLNHDQDAAGELLHTYFVEKGRGIYESMIQSDEQIEEEIGGDPVADFEEEVIADEAEIENEEMFSEEDGDMDPEAAAAEVSDAEAEMPADGAEEAPADDAKSSVEDAMMDVEDAISALKAEFDKLVNGEGDSEEAAPADDASAEMPADMPEESLGEAVDLAKVTSPDNGDKADNKTSPVSSGPEVSANGAAAVKFGQGNETGGKVAAPKSLNSTTEPNVKPAPKPVTAQASGVNVKSPISGA